MSLPWMATSGEYWHEYLMSAYQRAPPPAKGACGSWLARTCQLVELVIISRQ
jgi:hypothetical protein